MSAYTVTVGWASILYNTLSIADSNGLSMK